MDYTHINIYRYKINIYLGIKKNGMGVGGGGDGEDWGWHLQWLRHWFDKFFFENTIGLIVERYFILVFRLKDCKVMVFT